MEVVVYATGYKLKKIVLDLEVVIQVNLYISLYLNMFTSHVHRL